MNTTFDDMTAEFAWLKSELLAFVDERELNGVMPSLESLRSARRQDLVDGLARHGGRKACLLYTSPSPRDRTRSRMPSSA